MRYTRTYRPQTGDESVAAITLKTPELPRSLARSMALIEDPDSADPDRIADLVAGDPTIAAALLRVVNSGYYALRTTVDDIARAVVLLGPLTVTGTAMGMELLNLRESFPEAAQPAFLRLVRHSAAAAFLSRHVLQTVVSRDDAHESLTYAHVGEAFASGMMHDFGKLILLYSCPEQALDIYVDDAEHTHEEVSRLEEDFLGRNHTTIGGDFSDGLNFPDLVTRAIRCHHYPEEHQFDAYVDAALIRATCAGDVAATALGFGFPDGQRQSDSAEHTIWSQLSKHDLPESEGDLIRHELEQLGDHVAEFVSILTSSWQ